VSERRRDYMVSKRVHTLYLLTWVTSVLLVTSFAALVYALVKTSDVHNVRPLFNLINPFLLMGILAFVIVCAALFNGVYTIVHTHRLVGSAYRIGVVLREINEGKPTRVKLRDGDFFTDIGDEINRLADAQAPAGGDDAKAAAEAGGAVSVPSEDARVNASGGEGDKAEGEASSSTSA